MRLTGVILAVFLLWASPAMAETVTVRFKTSPPDAQVYLKTDPAGSPRPLGSADKPIELDLSKLAGQPSYTFVFRADGHLETWSVLYDLEQSQGGLKTQAQKQWQSLRDGTWPPQEAGGKLGLVILPQATMAPVIFWTDPPGAQVYLANVSSPGATGKPIGLSGELIHLPTADFWDPQTLLRDPVVQFKLPHYHDSDPIEATGLFDDLKSGEPLPPGHVSRFPRDASKRISLNPATFWAPAFYFVKAHPVATAVAVPLVLGGAVLAVATELKRRKTMRLLAAREERLGKLEQDARLREDQWVGKLLGKWRITRKLGAGGMAVVYQAIDDADLLLGDEAPAVALKLMNVDLSENEEFRKRFEREIDVCKKLNDPAIVRVEDFGNQDGHLYLVMELVDGEPLRDLVRPNFPIGEALNYFEQILKGLHHAHREGVVHRDIKPDNIMVTRDGRIKIMDFGLARKQDVNTQITQSGAVLGTPAYVSPEQITGGGMNKSSDQYSLGITFYEILTGRRPFSNEDSVALLFSHLSEQAVSMREWRPEIPESIDKVVLRMLLKDPSERFANLEECLKALQAARLDTSESPPDPGAMPQPRPERFNTNVAT